MDALSQKDIDRFWNKVNKTRSRTFYNGSRCWEWTAGTQDGYGRFRTVDGVYGVHRVSYELAFGEIPVDLLVCHHCDNRICCNPSHLFTGTRKDNADDMVSKGRHWRQIGKSVFKVQG